ncbi:3D domain-containing protein [Bdellovibrio sp. BCCA]|uniref:3D domain-containing protein n=1 Tax=Bdellovibrio sp. BCCA TaxID=3136281 RepID=UPI0030F2CBDC
MEKQNCLNKSFKIVPMVICSLIAMAEVGSARYSCPEGMAQSTVYFVPHIKDYCSSATPCAKFKRQVRMQGSGTLPGNKLLTYTGKTVDLGSCETAFGASGNCLIPYISVAADPRFYSMGDIIDMPALKGKVMTLPNGKTFVHPGYFIVQDTGGAIKGKGRFDFFTGSLNMKDPKNTFGAKGDPELPFLDKDACTNTKRFTVVRRSSFSYQQKLLAIEDALRSSSSSPKVMVASVFGGAK